jgi:hypothetical protein
VGSKIISESLSEKRWLEKREAALLNIGLLDDLEYSIDSQEDGTAGDEPVMCYGDEIPFRPSLMHDAPGSFIRTAEAFSSVKPRYNNDMVMTQKMDKPFPVAGFFGKWINRFHHATEFEIGLGKLRNDMIWSNIRGLNGFLCEGDGFFVVARDHFVTQRYPIRKIYAPIEHRAIPYRLVCRIISTAKEHIDDEMVDIYDQVAAGERAVKYLNKLGLSAEEGFAMLNRHWPENGDELFFNYNKKA